jgi:hypothetical protein
MEKISEGVASRVAPTLTAQEQRLITASNYPLYRAAQLKREFNEALATIGAAEAANNLVKAYGAIALRGLERIKPKLGATSKLHVEFTERRLREALNDFDREYRVLQSTAGSPLEAIKQLEAIEKNIYRSLGEALVANTRFRGR